MADAIVSIALERLADIALEKIGEEINLIKGVEKGVVSLSSELTTIRNVLEDAEKRRYKEKTIQNWLNKLEDLSYDVDDVLDEWNFAILKREIKRSENFVGPRPKVRSLITSSCLCFKKVATRRGIAVKIKRLKERLDLIVKEKDRYGFSPGTVGQVADPRVSERVRSTSFTDEKEIQGREADKADLVRKLILESAGQESGPDLVSIVGPGGIGKTSLAQLVYNDDSVKNCFKLQIWICVSEVFDEVSIAKGIMEIVEGPSPNVNELEAVLKCVADSISEKRFLLVLDDVWNEDSSKWEPIKNCLKCGGPGSKILVTTRSQRVARMMRAIEIHHLGQLSDTDCWLLMQRIAFSGRREEELVGLQDVGKNIAKKCKGLPLAAKVLGSCLCFKDTVEEWENVLSSEIWQLEKAELDLFPHLLLSYNELSPAMRRCFSYCSIFPKDSKIDVKKLIRMWMASGYLGSGGRSGDLELRGKEYFDTLRMRSFFQDFVEYGRDGMSCKMHDIVHDFAQFLTKSRVEAREQGSCRASDPSLVFQIKVNRSLFCPNELPSEDLLHFVTCLRVLSLRDCQLEEISAYVANLIHLRYLDLSENQLKLQVLQTICKLYNLQTLYLRDCELKKIPRELGNLIQLRELDLSSNQLKLQALQTICKFYNLQTLYLRRCRLKEIPMEFGNLIQLRHLDLSYNPLTPQALQTICKLYNLQTLSLRGCRLKEIPRELGNLIQLRELDLSRNRDMKELPDTICNLHELETLNLENCDSLSGLPQEIHRLKNLRHLFNEFTKDLCQIPQGFEQLTALRTLKEFKAEKGLGKLGYLKKLNQLSGSLVLEIYLHGLEDVEEAQRAELRNKKHIKFLKIYFFNETEGSDGEELMKNDAMEALQPHPDLQHLEIRNYEGTKFPNWITSSLDHLRSLRISDCNHCSTLPPLGKLPCLEYLHVVTMNGLEFLNREFLGISGNNNASVPSSSVVIGFPKLKKLNFDCCIRWKEWEDITAEEATNSAFSIMPCLSELKIASCDKLTALPHQLLRKASALKYLGIL